MMTSAFVRRGALVLLLLTVLNGCYSYVPVREGSLPKATRVRAHLKEPMEARLRETTANRVVLIEGEVVGMDERELVLSAFLLQSGSGYEHFGEGFTVVVPALNVEALERRRIDPARTGLFTAGLVALGAALAAVVNNVGGSEGGRDGGGQTQ